jgi:hypothetical protein
MLTKDFNLMLLSGKFDSFLGGIFVVVRNQIIFVHGSPWDFWRTALTALGAAQILHIKREARAMIRPFFQFLL